MLSQALLKVLPEGIQVYQELRILGLVLILYSPLLRDVVQGLGQGCTVVEQRMSHQRLEPLSPCSLPSLLGYNPFPIDFLTEIQYASGA